MLSSNFIKISIFLAIVGGTYARPQSASVGGGSSEDTNSKAVAFADEKLKPKIGKQPSDMTAKPPVKAEGLEWGPAGLAGNQPPSSAPEPGKNTENQQVPGGSAGTNGAPGTNETLGSQVPGPISPAPVPGVEGLDPKGPPGLNVPGLEVPPSSAPEIKKPLGKEAGKSSPLLPVESVPNGADPSKKSKKPDGPIPPVGDKAGLNSTAGKSERSSASKPLELSNSAITTGLLGVTVGLASIFV